ncbi:MAG: TetR/AcrR family transcriptional regulator [Frankiaceae bacterium]|nr:TetR/AcrR family transcriptional regulator [Frankiaceae bacterium]MBV9869699.1 TetR/AcrR family transcriptional regulator [Frankiaceae bacterium]
MTPVAVRMSAVERRADVLRAAIPVFARGGFHGTSTEDVAKAAGISQPYLFRLFPTKKALFIALIEQGFQRVRDEFIGAVGDKTGEDALHAMGEKYGELLRDRDELMLQMHSYSSSGADEDIAVVTRSEFGKLWREVARLSGADDETLQGFFATGMLMNVIASMDAASHSSSWIKACLPPAWLTSPAWDDDRPQ